ARIMRQVLVDHARARCAEKRGRAAVPETLDESLAADAPPETLLALDGALTKLAEIDPRAAEVVELVYFGGFEQKDVVVRLGVHTNTVARDLRSAEAWIKRTMSEV